MYIPLQVSGLSMWMGEQMSPLKTIPPWAIAIILCLLIATFTECTSNVATATLFLPVLASMVRIPAGFTSSYRKCHYTTEFLQGDGTMRDICVGSGDPQRETSYQWQGLWRERTNQSAVLKLLPEEAGPYVLVGRSNDGPFWLQILGPLSWAPPPISNLPNAHIQPSVLLWSPVSQPPCR